jgi:hypothetical protein
LACSALSLIFVASVSELSPCSFSSPLPLNITFRTSVAHLLPPALMPGEYAATST